MENGNRKKNYMMNQKNGEHLIDSGLDGKMPQILSYQVNMLVGLVLE